MITKDKATASSRKYSFPTLYFEVTRECNNSCPMCMTGCNNPEFVAKKKKAELSYQEIVEKVLIPAQRDLGVYQVGYSGGEFLLREDAIDLVRATAGLGCEVKITTNSVLVTEKLLKKLKDAAQNNLVMAFGINSIAQSEVNRETRNEDLETTLKAMKLCDSLGVTKHVVVTIGRFNMNDLDETIRWLAESHVPYNRSPLTGRNSGRNFINQCGLDSESMEQKIHPVLRKYPNGYISYTPFFLAPELHRKISGGQHVNVTVPQNPSIGCWCGTWIAVNAEGDVSPCAILLDEVNAGNVRQKSLLDIIDKGEVFQKILDRKQLKGRCGRCRYKFTCGGCRAMAWFKTSDYMDEDPTCFFEPVDETTISPHETETNKIFNRYARYAAAAGMFEPPDG